MPQEDLSILTKTHDMIKYAYLALAQFPKSEKFALAADIKSSMHRFLRLIITAVKRYHKTTTLTDLDIELMLLKHYVRLAFELGFLPPKKYEVWTEKLVELGKMLGGWIKSSAKR